MTSLQELVHKYPNDKSIDFHGHDYIPGYTELFEPHRSQIKTVLEIGIGSKAHENHYRRIVPNYNSGNSLRMWRDYFVNATIYGIDIVPDALFSEDRIVTMLADQFSNIHMTNLGKKIGKLDVVIDDGSHQASHQVASFIYLSPYLVKGSIYVIEDVQPDYIESFKNLSVFPTAFKQELINNYEISWIDTRAKTRFQDDFLMVFVKKS